MYWIPFHAAYALQWEGKAFWEVIASVSSAMNGWPGVPLKVSSVSSSSSSNNHNDDHDHDHHYHDDNNNDNASLPNCQDLRNE